MDIEKIAVSAIKNEISKTDRLSAFINDGDKEPCWDGNIYIHNDKFYSKNNIKKVSTQVKGKLIDSKRLIEDNIKYSISIKDLEAYKMNGGVIFFVVYIDKNIGEVKQIYYSDLLPFKIKKLLETKDKESKSCNIIFSKFPSDNCKKTEIFLNFYEDAKKQVSFTENSIPNIEELKQQGILENLSMKYIGVGENLSYNSFPQLVEGKSLTLYANLKGGVASIPVECWENIQDVVIFREQDISICVNDTKYYNSVKIKTTSSNIIFYIGSCMTIIMPNDGSIEKVKIKVEIKGTLSERIQGIEFLLASINNKVFTIGAFDVPCDFPIEELNRLNIKDLPNILEVYRKILKVLDVMNVKKELELDKCTKEDYWKLDVLINAIENKIPIKYIKANLPIVTNLYIANLHLVILCKRNEDGSYNIWDYFDKFLPTFCKCEGDSKVQSASQFDIMKVDDFLEVDNLNLESIIRNYKQIEPQEYLINSANNLMLEMIKAYDKSLKIDLLEAAQEINYWISEANNVNIFLPKDIVELNRLQIIARKRKLDYEEKLIIMKIIERTTDTFIKIGSYLLLDEQEEVQKIFSKMKKEEIERFKEFPIYKFYKYK